MISAAERTPVSPTNLASVGTVSTSIPTGSPSDIAARDVVFVMGETEMVCEPV